MDREKMLKKWQVLTLCEWFVLTCWYFITLCLIAFKPAVVYNIVNMFLWFCILCVVGFVFNKIKPEKRRIMPMIISIHNTVDKLKIQRIILIVIGFILCFSCHFVLNKEQTNIIMLAVSSLWLVFIQLANLVKDKIEYIKEKPEGL